MPYFKRKRKGKKKVSRRLYKKKASTNLGKLLDGKINTAVERRMVQIAQKEDRKQRDNRVIREFTHGSYDAATNEFVGLEISNVGTGHEFLHIKKKTGVSTLEPNGSRLGDSVRLSGMHFSMKSWLPENNSITNYETVTLNYAIVAVRDNWLPKAGDTYSPQPVSMDDLIPYYPFGYTPLIDKDESAGNRLKQFKVILKGKCFFKSSEVVARNHTIKKYVAFKKPWTINFSKDDGQDASSPREWKFYCALRASIPASMGSDMKPNCCVCVKTYYHEAL